MKPKRQIAANDIGRAFDVPPWLLGTSPRPRWAGLRWRLRKVAPWLVWR